jgi:outer membrane cobalamin receptor
MNRLHEGGIMKKKLAVWTLAAALAGLSPVRQDAAAAETAERPGVYTLGEIVVAGKTAGVEATETVDTVTDSDIRARGARTLDEAIALLPGVNLRTGGEGVPRIDIRGFRTRHIILLLDGIPLNSALDQQFDPTTIPTENIAEIKLTAGPSSVLYGQGGLGGVINIITKKGTRGIQGMIAGEAGDGEPYLARGSIGGTAGTVDFFLSGSATRITGFPLSDGFTPTVEQGNGLRLNSDRVRQNLLGTVGFTPTPDLSLGLTFSYEAGHYGKPASVINDPFDPFASPPKYERIDDYQGFSVQLAADYAVTGSLSIRGRGFVNRLDQQDNLYDDGTFSSFNQPGSFREQVTTTIAGGTVQPKYDLGAAGRVTLSLGGEQDSWQNSGTQTVSSGAATPLDADKTLGLFSAALEYEVEPLTGLGLVAGYSHHWQTRDELDQDDYGLLAGIRYDLFPGTRLKGAFRRNIRFPSLGDLYDLSKGNPNLVAERSTTYEGGVEQQLPLQSAVGLTGYHTIAYNLIQTDQATGKAMNLAEIRFTGMEFTAATRFVRRLLLRASYSHLVSEDRSRAGREEQQYTPGDKVTLEGRYDFACGFSPYASFLYVGNQYFYTKNNVTPVQKAKLNDYTLVNIKLSQRLFDDRATLYAGANNLFDTNYETSYGFPQAGRFIYGGVEFRF